ncbi:MAG: prephenate dehydrogenase/arogenate dehydrogenase family protein [Acidobacteriota bacterium]|nr:prephenate dehydrogenase/arogenate dehydrogenase family protein [Acidobacteriota bacterium]
METVAIIGVGLIGASFGLALQKAGFEGEILGVSSPRSIEAGLKAGAISRGVSLTDAAERADLIYLSQPIEGILNTLKDLAPLVRPDCLVTDAGSTKALIVSTAQEHIHAGNFLGGHPMAGKERRGAEAADCNLFRGRPYVLTPFHDNSAGNNVRVAQFRSWLERIGARLLEMDPQEHDATVALSSHLPQLLSTALAATLANQNSEHISKVFGPGLLDMTRLALSAPDVWMGVLATNKAAVREALDAFQITLTELQSRLQQDTLLDFFNVAARFSAQIRNTSYSD